MNHSNQCWSQLVVEGSHHHQSLRFLQPLPRIEKEPWSRDLHLLRIHNPTPHDPIPLLPLPPVIPLQWLHLKKMNNNLRKQREDFLPIPVEKMKRVFCKEFDLQSIVYTQWTRHTRKIHTMIMTPIVSWPCKAAISPLPINQLHLFGTYTPLLPPLYFLTHWFSLNPIFPLLNQSWKLTIKLLWFFTPSLTRNNTLNTHTNSLSPGEGNNVTYKPIINQRLPMLLYCSITTYTSQVHSQWLNRWNMEWKERQWKKEIQSGKNETTI